MANIDSQISKPAKPKWLKVSISGGERYSFVKKAINSGNLSTVCDEAKCPNKSECWNNGTATIMILGDICTRGCRFCAVKTGTPPAVDLNEPKKVADAVLKMKLSYAVITSVTRDDLEDGGASQFAKIIKAIKSLPTTPMVEVLTPDYKDKHLQTVLNAEPTVFAHNIEVVERLSPQLRHSRFSYKNSLETLRQASKNPKNITKSSIMLGLGESREEVIASLRDLRDAGVKILVLGQYLQPLKSKAPVVNYVHPDEFEQLKNEGLKMGFEFVASGPLVRTSYKAAEAYVKSRIKTSDN
ncbi:MAG: lipoyl synthase [Deltaproteobacteria bacterium]|nr:lipoyl synthase [Deltaproteobacteria bacterium]